ncbi:MAG TPA: UvrD-helicase domain-containing protein [Bryobacteraceae bacterium]
MIADSNEREAALDPSLSFIVEAPAGSGKTGLLVQRFLRLLSVVERPESIVAMTFTRKAAAEMKERVLEALVDAERGAPMASEYAQRTRELALDALHRNRQKGWDLMADPGRLQIQTIDAVCAMLTRLMPVVSDVGGESEVVEDAGDLYRRAARNTLRELTEGAEDSRELFHRVALYFDNDIARLETQVANMLQKRDQWDFLGRGDQPSVIDDFRELLHRAGQALRQVFRRASKVDFTEVARAARKALGTPDHPTDLLYALDYRIEHLLVDEFQDTSRVQYELLEALTEQWSDGDGRTLFLVGDPMQSIYGFREAEVALFLQCRELRRLGSVRLTPLRLTTNFRSTSEILEWVEETFAAIMCDDDLHLGAVKFRHSIAGRDEGGPKPRLCPFIEDNGKAEASEVVRIVKSSINGKIGLLVRSRAHITDILPALRKAEIPYQAIEIDRLTEQQHIIDLIALTRAILHLGDRVSWLACLRATWCGLTLADLSALAEDAPGVTILDLLSDSARISRLSPEGRSRAVRVQEILSAAVEHVGRLPLRELVEDTWLALGGAAVLREANQQDDVDTYLDLLESLDEGGIVRDFSILSQRLELLYARPSHAEGCLQVMTVHQAKGLEFDTVILPQLAKGTRPSDRDLLVWTQSIDDTGEPKLSVAAQPQKGEEDAEYKRICEDLKQKEAHELKRLFYVACTRAKNELHLLGSVETKKNRSECAKAGHATFLGLIWSSVEAQFQSELRRRVPVQQSLLPAEDDTRNTLLYRLPADWQAPRFDFSVDWKPQLARAAASSRPVTYEWVSDASRHAGTVVHDMLRRMAGESAVWTPARLAAFTPAIKAELLRLGVARSEEPKASARVLNALMKTLHSDRGQWILHPHAEARSEWPVAGLVQDRLISGTIDRVFRDEENRLWIIDFKTSEHKGSRLEFFLDEEQRRYREQLENYAALLSRVTPGPIWLGLYFPLLDGWREWQFAEEAVVAHYTGD